jgi:hypothetical protein
MDQARRSATNGGTIPSFGSDAAGSPREWHNRLTTEIAARSNRVARGFAFVKLSALSPRGGDRVNFLPPFEEIKGFVNFAAAKGELTVSASYTQFTILIRTLLQGIEVDEEWYLRQYPDIAEAIRNKTVNSAKEHFLSDGYFEGRLPFPIKVNEAWYLEQNPGVADYIARGELKSAQQHFNSNGYREGRRPFPR